MTTTKKPRAQSAYILFLKAANADTMASRRVQAISAPKQKQAERVKIGAAAWRHFKQKRQQKNPTYDSEVRDYIHGL